MVWGRRQSGIQLTNQNLQGKKAVKGRNPRQVQGNMDWQWQRRWMHNKWKEREEEERRAVLEEPWSWCPSPVSLPFILSLSIKSRFQSFNFFPSWVMNLKISLLEGKLRAYKFSPQKVVVILILKNVSSCPLPEMCEIGVVAGTSERTTYFSTGKIKSYFCIMSRFSPKPAFRGQAVCDPRKKGSVRIHRRALNTLLLADGLQQHAQQDRNWRTELDSI